MSYIEALFVPPSGTPRLIRKQRWALRQQTGTVKFVDQDTRLELKARRRSDMGLAAATTFQLGTEDKNVPLGRFRKHRAPDMPEPYGTFIISGLTPEGHETDVPISIIIAINADLHALP